MRIGSRRLLMLPFVAAVFGCGHHHPAVNAAVSPDLEVQADAEAHSAQPDGQRLANVLVGVALGPDQATDWRVPLEAGQCYVFGYAADASVSRFSIYIWDPMNRRLDSSRGRPGEGVFKHCATENGMYRLEGKVAEGAGHFVVVTYAKQVAPPPAPIPAGPVDLSAVIEAQANSAAPGATRVGDFFTGAGDQSDWYAQLTVGKCYWFIGAGEAGKVKNLYMYLWDTHLSRITENRSATEVSMVGHCPKEAGMYKFEAKLSSGKGAYKVGLYEK